MTDTTDAPALADGRDATTARAVLRTTIGPIHERLHANPRFAALLEGNLSRDDYARLLLCLLGLHAPIEHHLQRFDGHAWMHWRTAIAVVPNPVRIRADLADLGIGDDAISAALEPGAAVPALNDVAAAVGCAWTIEGSALGGRVLAKALDRVLGASHPGARAFLSPQPGQPERWRACCAAVERCGAAADRRRAMAAAAAATLGAFEAWLAPN